MASMFFPSIPELKHKILLGGMSVDAREYIKKTYRNALLMSGMLTVLLFFLVDKYNGNYLTLPLAFSIFFLIIYSVTFHTIDAHIKKRAHLLDRDVLFAGRFLLVKLNSGKPLVNAIIDASKAYGVANSFFQRISRDIHLGTPLEKALDNAFKYCPSEKFKRVLLQIMNALHIGIDVSRSLEATLDEIANEQLIEIQKYGKKLSSFTMFYMLLAIVIPSLGMTLFIVVSSLTSFNIGSAVFFLIGFFIVMIQVFFVILFRAIRPNINI